MMPLINSQALQALINDPELIILDASEATNKAGISSEHQNIRIKGARFFDLKNDFSDSNGRFPNTFPGVQQFEHSCRKLGINSSSKIVVYDNLGVYTSPRAWWLFKAMGHDNVFVLDGGLPDWIEHGYETEEIKEEEYPQGDFVAELHPEMVKDYAFIKMNTDKQEALVIDARSEGRFNGTAPEPRAGLRSGSIPHSVNLPYTAVLHQGKYKPVPELKRLFEDIIKEDKPLVFSCGSGITACIILLACELVSEKKKSVYDGSWTEWASLEK